MITANELKITGIKAIEDQLSKTTEAAITLYGKAKYIVMTVERFEKLRQAELELAFWVCKKR